MDTFIHADIFFFITSIAVVVLTVLLVIALFYFIQILMNFRDISRILKNGADNVGERLEALTENLAENPIFRFLFAIKNKREKKNKRTKKE